jgi:NADPH:quinone reductase-like Zn-dependent oxidoreductase
LPGGTYVTTVPGPDLVVWAGWGYVAGLLGPTRKAKFILVSRRGEDLELLGRWADEGKLKPTISHVFPLDRAADALEASQSGHTRGKIVLEL